MTNPFTVMASEVRTGTRTRTLPPSLPAILVICIVGFIAVASLGMYFVLQYQGKPTGQLDTIILTSSAAILGTLAKLSGSEPVSQPQDELAPKPPPYDPLAQALLER